VVFVYVCGDEEGVGVFDSEFEWSNPLKDGGWFFVSS
jgi:hypothetical protein